jgi:hypothetical protein
MTSGISHKNQEISLLMIKKMESEVNTSLSSQREFQRRKDKTENKGPRSKKEKTQKQYEQQCQSHTCSGTINSSMYDSDFSITTFSLTLSAPYSG